MVSTSLVRHTATGVACATIAGLVAAAACPARAADPVVPSRSLQSVNIAVGGDGSVRTIADTVVSGYSDGSSDTKHHSYLPTRDAQGLPVRVQTSYYTAKRSGTDLSDLDGYSGRVRIDVTVQNTTVHAEPVSFDAGGVSHRQYALVGVPMTVVASASLGKGEASDVVTNGDSSDGGVTNGVLSQTKDGTGQVQWATLLAPPRLAPTTTFTLVLSADHLKVPSFDISVQPGLATDPSIGGLLDTAFGTEGNDQLALESRTIEVVDSVTGVLGQADTTLAKVRKTLSQSADTLGRRTVEQLRSSMSTVTGNTTEMARSLKALNTSLAKAMRATNTTAVGQMQQLVTRVSTLLGDTSQQETSVKTTGSGCQTAIDTSQRTESVYDAVLRVSGMLDAYADATGSCRQAIADRLVSTIGTSDVSNCPTSKPMSVTCTIAATTTKFGSYATKLMQDSQAAIDALNPALVTTAFAKLQSLKAALTGISGLAAALHYDDQDGFEQTLGDVTTSQSDLATAAAALADLSTAIDTVRTALVKERDELSGGSDSMLQETTDLKSAVCALYDANTLSKDQMQQLTSYITATDCDDESVAPPVPGGATQAYAGSLAERISDSSEALADQIDALDTSSTNNAVGAALAKVGARIAAAQDQLASLHDQLEASDSDTPRGLAGVLNSILSGISGYATPLRELETALGAANDNQQAAVSAITRAQQQLDADAGNAAGELDPTIRVVADAASTAEGDLGDLFTQSQTELQSAAKTARDSAKGTIDRQRDDLSSTAASDGRQLTKQMDSGIASISTNVTAANRDSQAASKLLSKALQQVLVSVGDRRVQGSGLLGIITTSAAATNDGSEQLAHASTLADSFGNVRGGELDGLYLEQAQMERSMALLSGLAPYKLTLPSGTQHATVYNFSVQGN